MMTYGFDVWARASHRAFVPSPSSRFASRRAALQSLALGDLMGKRSSFERVPRDFYPTPREAVLPLLPYLPRGTRFVEPCAGSFVLANHLVEAGLICVRVFDIEPKHPFVRQGDAVCAKIAPGSADYAITNPPWSRVTLHKIILNLSRQLPTWLLFDADWMHTRQSVPFMPFLRKIVSVGRVKWIAGSPFTGKDNCCWYLFDQTAEAPAQFIGRAA
jgi:hypothetical protein